MAIQQLNNGAGPTLLLPNVTHSESEEEFKLIPAFRRYWLAPPSMELSLCDHEDEQLYPQVLIEPKPLVLPNFYRHYKGGLYYVFLTAQLICTTELLVVYANVKKLDRAWCRPHAMFCDFKRLEDGKLVKRFAPFPFDTSP